MKIRSLFFIALTLAAAACVLCVPALAADRALTRGEFVTELFSLSPENNADAHQEAFDDVPSDGGLARALRWASDKGIVNGYGDRRFGPDDFVTREQAATMLWRYAGALGLSTRGDPVFSAGLSGSDKISAYADAALQWAVMNRIFTATENGLEPKAAVTEDLLPSVALSWNRFLASGGENKGICILYTSDVHCGIDKGFGYAGLCQIKNTLEAEGYTVLLVDDGDSTQGDVIGTLTKGEKLIELMNVLGYDVAAPGNHEFDYGMARFLELAGTADFPYVSCNFTYLDEPVFERYIVKEIAGIKIAFVGITTPQTIADSTPAFFQDENGEFIYGFMQDETGEKLYNAVQAAVDAARAEGAELVYVLGHTGLDASASPWTYAEIIENTGGIDVFFDGHSHDTEQVVMKDKDGKTVVRSACGTELSCVGYSFISAEGKVTDTGVWSWANATSAPELLNIENEVSATVDAAKSEIEELTEKVVAKSEVVLTIYDPVQKNSSGNPVRMVRRAETNLGDFCADVLREETGADIALINGGGIRCDISRGDVTYRAILSVWPYQNSVCVIKATGQQILDALEWGARNTPGENGGFLQTSGLSYEIHVNVPNGCKVDENGMMAGIEGERRVRNVTVGGVPIDPESCYTVAGIYYILINGGDGFTAFDGASVVIENAGLDSQILIDHITEKLNGVIGAEYADPYGQGRITVVEN